MLAQDSPDIEHHGAECAINGIVQRGGFVNVRNAPLIHRAE
jgi:hypothetical protein